MVREDDVRIARERIAPYIRTTPLVVSSGDFPFQTNPIQLKLELFQHAGSFKPRGAFNNLLSKSVPAAGVAAASGGNHGAALAYAASVLGYPANIFVPEISTAGKQRKIREAGANIHIGGARYADALALCDDYISESRALSVHAYDDAATVAGQGTLGLEWEEQSIAIGGLPDTILVAVGGGGLIGGIIAAIGTRTNIVAVEPEGSDCLHAALEKGRPVNVDVNSIAADSLGAKSVGNIPYEICNIGLSNSITVTDYDIRAAQTLLWQKYQMVTEPGGATALAGLTSGAYQPKKDEKLGILICGANADLSVFA